MNIFDESELNKKLAEAEAAFGLEEKKEEPEIEEEIIEEPQEELQEEEEPIEEPEIEEEKRPKDGNAWKKLREEKKAAKQEAESAKLAAAEKEKQLFELKERLARLEGREEARAKPVVEEVDKDPEPDADLDPDLHIRWQLRQTNKKIEAAEKRAERAEQLAQIEGTRRGLDMLEKEYVKSNKINDYEDAVQHIKNVNRNLIKLEYPQATDQQIDAHLEAEKIKKAKDSYEKGINPAEYFYKMAQTLGYQKSKGDSKPNKPNIDALKRNMGKNANLLGASNADTTGGVPTDRVVKMSIEQLLKQEGSAALEAAIRREEAKLMGL
jgi:hypothetical protein